MQWSSFFLLFSHFLSVKSQYESCYLPPYPHNGRYVVENKPWAMPGDIVSEYTIKLICELGYELVGDPRATCSYGIMSGDSLAECLPYCSKPAPKLVSCGVSEQGITARCLLSSQNSLDIIDKVNTIEQMSKEQEKEKIEDKEHPECGIQTSVNNNILAGAREALLGELPWLVGVYSKKSTPYQQICGGTIVSDQVVISAAHCFWSETTKQLPASDFAVGAGKIYRAWDDVRDENAQKTEVQEIKLPPRFQGSTTNYQDDIALLLTETSFVFNDAIRPACLNFDFDFDEEQLSGGHQGQVGGWGLTRSNGEPSPVLMTLEFPYVNIEDCITSTQIGFKEHITSDKICAGHNNGTAICRVDRGGGLCFPSIKGGVPKYYLRGIISTSPVNDNPCHLYTWATFTHVNKHQRFIKSVMKPKQDGLK